MDSASVGKALRAEFFVIRDFLNASGILDYFASDDIDICVRYHVKSLSEKIRNFSSIALLRLSSTHG